MEDGAASVVPSRAELGCAGERAAVAAYAARGYALVASNWRCSLGEIDAVLARDGVLVFCEVKTRRGSALGGPFDAVTVAKQRRLRALAAAFLASGQALRDAGGCEVRFDVASVWIDGRGRPAVHLFEDAF